MVKIYKKNNYCVVDNGIKKEYFAGDEMSIALYDGGEWVIWNTAKQTESFTFNYADVQDESGTPVGDALAVEEYLTVNTNFKAASGGSGAAWGTITGALANQTDLQTELDNKVNKNTPVAGATKAKITFDSKGLVTDGENLSASDIPNIAQTQVTNLVTDLSNKQENLISGTNIKTINGDSVLGSGNLVISGGGGGGSAGGLQTPNPGTIFNWPTSASISGVPMQNNTMQIDEVLFTQYAPMSTFTTASLGVNVVTPQTGLGRIMVYDNNPSGFDRRPGGLLYSSTDLDMSTSGIKSATTAFTFTAGQIYWLSFQSNCNVTVAGFKNDNLIPIGVFGTNIVTTLRQVGTAYSIGAKNPSGVNSFDFGPMPVIYIQL